MLDKWIPNQYIATSLMDTTNVREGKMQRALADVSPAAATVSTVDATFNDDDRI